MNGISPENVAAAWGGGFVILSYFLGSIPFGLLIAKMRGVDLRKQGSGNIGATNVFRCVGKGWGILALLLDALKGFIPAFVFPLIYARIAGAGAPPWLSLVLGATAVAGHNWPVWLGFAGGKGVATSAGMLLGVAPAAMGIAMAVFAVALAAFRRVSVGSILAAVTVAVAGWVFYYQDNPILALILTALAALVILRHRANIQRLLAGAEPPLWGRGAEKKG